MNLPNALVYDLVYNQQDDVLVAGTLGRGAWTFPNASAILAGQEGTQLSIAVDDSVKPEGDAGNTTLS